ncbi:MAG: RNA methyltransferase [Chlamydiales bacterium]|nr:RNA methyltransferase [Chlamydiia bacterium]MCP5505099.1 RNA methyltransferase [Chlamydiales bacterium]
MISELLKVYPKEKIIETLVPFLTEERMETIDQVLTNRMSSVQIAIERPYDIHNGLAVVRTAEALGVSHIHFINAQMKKGQGKGTTKGTMKWVHLHRHPSLKEFHEATGDLLLAGASADGERSLQDLPLDRPICFLFGNEKEGISEEAKDGCDLLFHVPMFGMVESYNLSVAAAMTLYDYLKRKRETLQRSGDLNNQEMIEEKARFYVRSLGIEQSSEILKRYLS